MQGSKTNTVKILLVEDDEDDQFMLHKIFSMQLPSAELIQIFNGEECLEYLEKNIESLPALITMDLNMPLVNGIEATGRLKNDARFKHIITVILSTSDRDTDKKAAAEKGADDYFVKAVEYDRLKEVIQSIIDKWL